MVEAALGIIGDAPGDHWLKETARWAWRVKLRLSMMLDLMGELRERAQDEVDPGLRSKPQGPAAGSAGGRAADNGS